MRMTNGACMCGNVKIALSGDPSVMGICHCSSCRQWSGDPIHAFTIWSVDKVSVIAGADDLRTYKNTPDTLSHRQFCSNCGGHLMIHHPKLGVYDVLPGVLDGFEFEPAMHLNCQEWVIKQTDKLPKFKDFPTEFEQFGGTREMMPE